MRLSPEYILDKNADEACWIIAQDLQENVIIPSMEEYGKQQYNQAIKDAAENCTTELTSTCIRADKASILKLLKP